MKLKYSYNVTYVKGQWTVGVSENHKNPFICQHIYVRDYTTGQEFPAVCHFFFFSWNFSIAGNGLSCFLSRLGCYQFHSDIPSFSLECFVTLMNECIYFLTMRTLIYITEGSSFLLPLTQDCCKNLLFKHTSIIWTFRKRAP